MRTLRMLSGLAARFKGWLVEPEAPTKRETDRDRRAAEALAAMRDANDAMAALGAASADAAVATGGFGDACASLGGCYHDAVAYSLGYEVSPGVIELCGETFTTLDTGIDGGARAALRRHRQNYDPDRDVERLIVALKPVGVVGGRKEDGDAIEAYGLPPGPLAGNPVTAEVWGEHVASGRFDGEAVRPSMGGTIERFAGPDRFLSNFHPAEIVWEGRVYPSSEHLYQAMKAGTEEEKEWVRTAQTPAKFRGRRIRAASDWSKRRICAMRSALEMKFDQHPELAAKLDETGDAELLEGNTWGDTFWGIDEDTGQGENHLGGLLMELRARRREP